MAQMSPGNTPVTPNLASLIAAEATLARSADNITSGTLAAARVGDLSATYAPVPSGMDIGTGTRHSTLCVTNPRLNGLGLFDWTQRFIVRFPVNTTRWRMRIANRDRATTIYTSPAVVNGLYMGTPEYAAVDPYRWTGNFTATPTTVWAGGTVPTDGTELVSPWFTNNFIAGQETLVSMGVVAQNSGTGVIYDESVQTWRVTSNGSAQAGNTTLSGGVLVANGVMFDIRIEYDYVGVEPIGLFVGDSITAGYGDGDTTATAKGSCGSETFPAIAGMEGRFNYINAGAPAATAATWSPITNWIWQRLTFGTIPDFAVITLGTNDVSASLALATFKANLLAVVNIVKGLGIKKIYISTIAPRAYTTDTGTLVTGVSAGATSISSTTNFLGVTYPGETTGAIVIGQGAQQEIAIVSAASGTGPYTLTVGALAKAHAANVQIIANKEKIRQQINDWIRNRPFGVAGVVDLDAILALTPGNTSPDPRLMSLDQLHPIRAGYALIGATYAALRA